MYLKSLEIAGFKSFPVRTHLEFGKGMTAVVGPNGCGKSNISDAIRWALGEQSAKALRGAKMEDCIFSGTDTRKALGMAEVSLTFSDCEKTIETEFHDITVTRRVFRSGESQYFINKTPCRLKDIQRLFMDTGIGTSSYSLMEQGRVDLILSSRPEDRRAVFEEASGITKYKTDKREALRKLEQTEANLARLSDVIREVRRQIISLQRQAGKAKRARSLKQELRSLDIFLSGSRLKEMDAVVRQLEAQVVSNRETVEALQEDIRGLEQAGESIRAALSQAEQDIHIATQKDAELGAALQRAGHLAEAGEKRINELRDLLQRDSSDAATAESELEKQRRVFQAADGAIEKAREELALAESELDEKTRLHAEHEEAQEEMRQSLESLYTDSIDLENRLASLQNRLHDMEARDRNIARARERTSAERAGLARALDGYERRIADFEAVLKEFELRVSEAESALSESIRERDGIVNAVEAAEHARSELRLRMSSGEARLEIIEKNISQGHALSAEAARLFQAAGVSGVGADGLVCTLFEQLEIEPGFRTPVEAALRSVLGAALVSSLEDGLNLMRRLECGERGHVLLLAVDGTGEPESPAGAYAPGTPLIDRVSCPERILPVVRRLLLGTLVVETLEDVPSVIPERVTYVTMRGAVVRASGLMEFSRVDVNPDDPAAEGGRIPGLRDSITELKAGIELRDDELLKLAAKREECEKAVERHRAAAAEAHNALARKEGEHQSLEGQAKSMRENLETVVCELQELEEQGSPVEERGEVATEVDRTRADIERTKNSIADRKIELQDMEQKRRRLASEATEARVRFAQRKQAAEHLDAQHAPLSQRIAALESLIEDRSARAETYRGEIEQQQKIISGAREQAPATKREMEENASRLAEMRERCAAAQKEQQSLAEKLKARRTSLDEFRERYGELNAGLVEKQMKREALIERITSEYKMPADAIEREPPPQWEDGEPDSETLENRIAELRAKLEAIGPVYDGAIDEYRELEERLAFLNQQQDDLVKSRQQLMDMIKKIDRTTTEMFEQTFTVINNNFQTIFKQLFGGGSARLMLADDEDVLESGVEIIARPPGKRLQSVSLLSGGERALTAVSLLFAIYLFKPSPFCVLDELDAPLDDANIGRFINMLKGFLEQSQFVLITHNRQTISAADVLYGITMEEFGVSKVVSMKFMDRKDAAPEKSGEAADHRVPAQVSS